MPVQLVSPAWHVSAHAPFEQTSPAGHGVPHAPQFAVSVLRLTQAEPQISAAAPEQLALHAGADAPMAHSGADSGHFVPQAPQFCESIRLVSQMSSACVEQ